MEMKVETNVPVPTSTRKGNSAFEKVYSSISALAPGQCLTFAPEIKAGLKNPMGNAVYNCRKHARTLVGKSFVVKEMEDGNVRVWNTTPVVEAPKTELVPPTETPALEAEGEQIPE